MTIKNIAGNATIALSSYFGAKSAVLAATTVDYSTQFNESYSLVGFAVPNWFGVVFYIVFLMLGAIASYNQPTPVDDKFKHPQLKPFYSLTFGVLVTLFVVPQFYPDITIWGLIWPALFFAAIGAVVIYYVIAFFTSARLWILLSDEAIAFVGLSLKLVKTRIKAVWAALTGGSHNGDA